METENGGLPITSRSQLPSVIDDFVNFEIDATMLVQMSSNSTTQPRRSTESN